MENRWLCYWQTHWCVGGRGAFYKKNVRGGGQCGDRAYPAWFSGGISDTAWDDPFGHYIEQALKDNGIGTNLLTYDTVYRTGIQLKEYVEDGHDPAAPYYRKGSAASHLSAQEIDALDLEEIGLVHVTGIPPALSKEAREATYRLMERAREVQIPVTFDPNLRPALWENGETMRNVLNDLANYADVYCRESGNVRSLRARQIKKKRLIFIIRRARLSS